MRIAHSGGGLYGVNAKSVLLTRLQKRGEAPGSIEGYNVFLRHCRRTRTQMAVAQPNISLALRVPRQFVFLRLNVRLCPDVRSAPPHLAISPRKVPVPVFTVYTHRKVILVKRRRIFIRTPRAQTPPSRSNRKLLRVVTPRAAAPTGKTALERGAVLWEEVQTRREIAELEGRVYLPARKRHIVQPSIGPDGADLNVRRKVSGRAPAVTACRVVTIGRRPLNSAPQPRRRRNKHFYCFIDDEAEEVPHEVAVIEDEAIPAERRSGYDTDECEDELEEESDGEDEAVDPS